MKLVSMLCREDAAGMVVMRAKVIVLTSGLQHRQVVITDGDGGFVAMMLALAVQKTDGISVAQSAALKIDQKKGGSCHYFF